MIIHPVPVVIFWVLTGFIFDIRVRYKSGAELTLQGWPGNIARWWRERHE